MNEKLLHKIVDQKEIKECPTCKSHLISKEFEDWNGIHYSLCGECYGAYQNPRLYIDYEESYWGEITDPDGNRRILANERKSKIKNWYGASIDYVNQQKPGKIIDIGAGLGFFLSAINKSWEKYAQDYSKYSLDFVVQNDPSVKICTKDVYNLEFKDKFFDVVMFYHVIEHVDHPNDALAEINRILKKEGKLIIGTPNIKSIAARLFKGRFRHYGPPHINLFTPKNLEELLIKNGFSIEKIERPFFGTDYATFGNLLRMLFPVGISPAFYGSVMTYYCKKN